MSRYNVVQRDRSGSMFGPTRSSDLGRGMTARDAQRELERHARDSGHGRSFEITDGQGRVVGKAENGRITQRVRF